MCNNVSSLVCVAATALLIHGSAIAQPAFGPWTQNGYDQQRTGRSHLIGPRGEPILRWTAPIRSNSGPLHPAVGPDGTIYSGFADPSGRQFVALSPVDGALLWSYGIRGRIGGTPTIGADGTIFIADDSWWMYALSPSGELVWERLAPEEVFGSPLVRDDNSIILSTTDSGGTAYLLALNGATGDEVWRTAVGSAGMTNPILGLEGRIFINSGNGQTNNAIRAFSPTGELLWSSIAIAPSDLEHGAVGLDGILYHGDVRGRVGAFNPADGATIWRRDVGCPRIFSPAIGLNGQVIAGTNDGVVRAYHPLQGAIVWQFDTGNQGGTGVSIDAEGVIYYGASNTLFALLPDGQELWRLQLPNEIQEIIPVIGGPGRLYISDRSGFLHAIEGELPCDPCDTNCDGDINSFDIEPFLDLLFDPDAVPCSPCAGNTDGDPDGNINSFDIEPFLECLFGP